VFIDGIGLYQWHCWNNIITGTAAGQSDVFVDKVYVVRDLGSVQHTLAWISVVMWCPLYPDVQLDVKR
jgi:hypothetical protein